MKLMVSLVGNRDPFGDGGSDGPVLTAAREVQPNHVHLIATPDTGRHARKTATALRKALVKVKVTIHPLSVEDPTDYHEINDVLPGVLKDALFRVGDDVELECAASSGTAQLRMMLMLLLRGTGRPVRYWETRAPQHVTATRPRVSEIPLGYIEPGARTARIEQAWRLHDFTGVALLVREQAASRPLGQAAALLNWVADLADVYARWDAVDWAGARTGLQAARARIDERSPVAILRAQLAQQEAALARLAAIQAQEHPQEDYWSMLDLYHNARRCLDAGRYVDALARWRRVLEGTLYAAVRAIPGCAISRRGVMTVSVDLEPVWREDQARRARDSDRPPPEPGSSVNIPDLLFVLRHTGRLTSQFSTSIDGLKQARDDSIAAHGMKPVSEAEARAALKQAHDMLVQLFPTQSAPDPPDRYAFGAAALEDLGKTLAEIVRAAH